MIEPEKLIRDGKVAVLVSPGYGAGWSTWIHDQGASRFALFDRRMVEAREKAATAGEVEKLISDTFGLEYVCTLGWGQVEVRWIEPGTTFYINDYDGSESIRYPGDGNDWHAA